MLPNSFPKDFGSWSTFWKSKNPQYFLSLEAVAENKLSTTVSHDFRDLISGLTINCDLPEVLKIGIACLSFGILRQYKIPYKVQLWIP